MRSADNLEALLVTVTRRRALDELRSRGRQQRRQQRLHVLHEEISDDVALEVSARAEAAWADAAARQLLATPGYEVLRGVAAGQSVGDVALDLGLTKRAAESHLLRARRTMRQALTGALAALGLLAAAARRIAGGPAVATATVATALVLGTLVTSIPEDEPDAPAGSTPPTWTATFLTDARRPTVARTSHRQTAPLPRTASSTGAPSRIGPGSRNVASLHGPAATTVSVKEEDHGREEHGAVAIVVACAENLEVSQQRIGC